MEPPKNKLEWDVALNWILTNVVWPCKEPKPCPNCIAVVAGMKTGYQWVWGCKQAVAEYRRVNP
jgi:hypothetical protein